MTLTLIPVALIESTVLRRRLGVRWNTGVKLAFASNIVSTLIGVPLAWVCWISIGEMTNSYSHDPDRMEHLSLWNIATHSFWLSPHRGFPTWAIPFAAMTLLIPCFLLSVPIESWVIARLARTIPTKVIRAASWRANLASYALLFAACLLWANIAVATG